ncbi:MAG: DNA alkylation repair protein [Spirochaetota bacterium]
MKELKKLTSPARSENIWERRTAIVSTYAFIKNNELADTFQIAEILIDDTEELIYKAVGSWIREAGKKNESRLVAFLDKYAATMPRVTLRYATEKLDKNKRKFYRELRKKQSKK